MDKIEIPGTKSTPEVCFDAEAGRLMIKGQSYPENAFKFFEPLFNWVDDYLQSMRESALVSIELDLPYINTSSTKCFMILLEKFDEAFQAGKKVQIQWYYNTENESGLECAEEFKEDLTLPFEIIAKED